MKKIISMTLVLLMLVAALTGCGGSGFGDKAFKVGV